MSVAADQQFQYTPLEPYQIRLLKLQPSDDPQKLCYTLHHVGLQEAPAYSAISYRWGDPLSTTTIYIDGQLMPVTNNLWHCLHHLMLRAWPKYLWVDAICINQADIAERGEQVGFMHEIYSQPDEVIAWLGHDPSGCTLAFELKAQMAKAPVDRQGLLPTYWRRRWIAESWAKEIEIRAFMTLADNEYWQRAWIVQEFLAPKDVLLVYGAHAISWRSLATCFDIMKQSAPCTKLLGAEHSDKDYLNGPAAQLCQNRAELMRSGYEQPEANFYGLLLRYRYAKCSDIRDKIFSLIGLDRQGGGQRSFSADYTLPVHELMVHASAYIQLSSSTHPGLACCNLLQSTLGVDACSSDFRNFYLALLEGEEWTRSDFMKIILDPDGPSRAEAIWDTGVVVHIITETSARVETQVLQDEHQKWTHLGHSAEPLVEDLAKVNSCNKEVSAIVNDCSTAFNVAWVEGANLNECVDSLPNESYLADSCLLRRELRAFVCANGEVGLACPSARADDLLCRIETPTGHLGNSKPGIPIMLVLRSVCPGVFSIIGNAVLLQVYKTGSKLAQHNVSTDTNEKLFQKVKIMMDPLSAFTLSTPFNMPVS